MRATSFRGFGRAFEPGVGAGRQPSLTQRLRLPLAGGLMTPAMWPEAPSTNLLAWCGAAPLTSAVDA